MTTRDNKLHKALHVEISGSGQGKEVDAWCYGRTTVCLLVAYPDGTWNTYIVTLPRVRKT